MSANEYEQALEQLDEIICPRCLGTGTVPAMSDNSPDAYEVEVCCDHCDGSGTAGSAYKVLSAYYSKARIELIQLRAFKRHVEQEQAKTKAAEPVAWVDERAIAWLADRAGKASAGITTKLQAVKSPERPMPLYR